MMPIALMALMVVAVLSVAITAWYSRTVKLRRLERLVESGPNYSARAENEDVHRFLERLFPNAVSRSFRLFGIEPSARDIAAAAGTICLSIIVAGTLLGVVAAVALAAVVLLAGIVAANILANRRVAELGAMMPVFFDRVRQLLIVGNSLPVAFTRAVHGAQPRLASFFAAAIRRIGNGASFSETIRQSAEDIDLYEMHLFATAVTANMRFGGSLTHSLANLVAYLRKRSSIERELRANTAQIRFSAWVLALLPVLAAVLIVLQNPDYARWFIIDPVGRWMLSYGAISQVVGVIVMRFIVKTEF